MGSYPQPGQLTRPRNNRMIAGVCAGFALHYGWDVTVVRILTAVIAFCSAGFGILAYLAAWVIIPEAPYALPAKSL
jgi:phage shock protein C